MNADTYLLLNTVLRACPCVDSTLDSTTHTAPLVLHAIAQQCFYVIYVVSSTRALLFDDRSTYSVVVRQLVAQQELLERTYLDRVTAACNGGTSVDLTATALLQEVDEAVARARQAFAPLPSVLPCGSLEMNVTVIGGGTVSRRLLHVLLDEHDGFLHSTRITVITRQPEHFNLFASRGVLCVDRKHGRSSINRADVLVLACQPEQFAEFVKEHFTAKSFAQEDDPAPPAALKRTALVFSCLAGVATQKIAALLRHNPQLIVRADVRTSPTMVPAVAARYEALKQRCTEQKVQYMTDHDSFLQGAVKEAERLHIVRAAENMLDEEAREGPEGESTGREGETQTVVPRTIRYRAALAAATRATQNQHQPRAIAEVVRQEVPPPYSFLCHVWLTVQCLIGLSAETVASGNATQHDSHPGRAAHETPPLRSTSTGRNAARSSSSEGPFLCTAFVTLPAALHESTALVTVQRYATHVVHFLHQHCAFPVEGDHEADEQEDMLAHEILHHNVAEDEANDEEDDKDAGGMDDARAGHAVTGQSVERSRLALRVAAAVMRRLPGVFAEPEQVLHGLREQYQRIIATRREPSIIA